MKTVPVHLVCSLVMILLVVSCGNKVNYDFIVKDLDAVGEKKVDFKFKEKKGTRYITRTYSMDFARSQRLSIDPGLTFSGLVSWGDASNVLYPDLGSVSSGGRIEVFFFNPIKVTKSNEDTFEVSPIVKVTAYFVRFVKDETVLTVISKDNLLEVSSPRESLDLSKILSSNFDDLTVFDINEQPMLEGLKENGGFRGGLYCRKQNRWNIPLVAVIA